MRGVARLERAMRAAVAAEPYERILRNAIRSREVPGGPVAESVSAAVAAKLLTPDEAGILLEAEELRDDAIQVDDFTLEEYKRTAVEDEASFHAARS
jgi:acyl-CoA dehydrogenase